MRFVCYAFVDDTDLFQAADTPETEWTVVKDKMQEQIDHWEGGLRATGGALREDKSFWYLIDYEWKKGKWVYKTIDDTPGDITVRVDKGHREVIQRLEPQEARETVGVWLAMDGNNIKQAEVHKEKTLAFDDGTQVLSRLT